MRQHRLTAIAFAFASIIGTTLLAGCTAPASEGDGDTQKSASSNTARTRSVSSSESVLGAVLSSKMIHVSAGLTWQVLEVSVPVDLVGNNRQLVVLAQAGGVTRIWELDQVARVEVKSTGTQRGSFALELERYFRGEGGLQSEKVDLTVAYEMRGTAVDETLTLTSKDGVETAKASSDATLEELKGLSTVHAPIGNEPELRLLQVTGSDSLVNPISLRLAAKKGRDTAHFDLGLVAGEVNAVVARGKKLEVSVTLESLDTDAKQGVRYEIEVDPELGTATIKTL